METFFNYYLKMSLAVILSYRSLISPTALPPMHVPGPISTKPITIDLKLLERILLFGDLTKPPKPGKIAGNLHSLYF